MRQTIIFQEVKVKGSKKCKCTCGKRVSRSKTFSQTINPWNKNKEGNPKSFGEIQEELSNERNEWMNEKELCSNCS